MIETHALSVFVRTTGMPSAIDPAESSTENTRFFPVSTRSSSDGNSHR